MRLQRIGHSVLAVAAACALSAGALAGCGPSVSDAKADAYQKLDSLSDLDTGDREEFKPRLDKATDKAAIDQIMAEAEARNQEKANDRTSRESAAQSIVDSAQTLVGKTLTLEEPSSTMGVAQYCAGLSIRLNEDGSVTRVAEVDGEPCEYPDSWAILPPDDHNAIRGGLYFNGNTYARTEFEILENGAKVRIDSGPVGNKMYAGVWSVK